MSFFHEVRRQPRGIRQAMFVLSVVTTLSLVGMVWLNSFQEDMYALLNPVDETAPEQRSFASEEGFESPFEFLGAAFDSAAATVLELFDGSSETKNRSQNPQASVVPARLFPLSRPR